jgi:hypothetical protein
VILQPQHTQKTACLLDYPGLGLNKPSIRMDQLITLKLDSLDDIIKALFFPRILRYIHELSTLKTKK